MLKNTLKSWESVLMITLVLPLFVSCGGEDDPDPNGGGQSPTEISLTLPSSIDVVKGKPCTLPQDGAQVLMSDMIYLEKDGKITACAVVESTSDHFSFNLPEKFENGTYKLQIKRGDRRIPVGNITITLIAHQIEIKPGTTIYGVVESAEGPIAGVVVSDGVETTVTDNNGEYQLKSAKETGYVFISVPSGYECQLNGVFPDHYRTLIGNASTPENQSFMLNKVDQSNYKVIFMGDMHVANRSSNNDLGQFKKVAADIKSYVNTLGSKRVYAITLGDMTWDLYWYDRKFAPADYHKTINEVLSGLPIYHTIGNHDNDMRAFGNAGAKNPFSVNIAPPYYSFNIGGVHYIMLDNVDCVNYIGDETRNHIDGQIYDPQWAWLAKDLSYVDKSTPVLVMMHVPVFKQDGVNSFAKNMPDADKLIAALNGFQTVHFVTGHTHRSYNIVPENTAVTGGRNIYEHNLSAICSDWWWSGNYTPGLLQASDGTPSGYGVWDISGKDIKWIYKCAGKDENFQFRSYDLNNITFSLEKDVPQLTNADMKQVFKNMIVDYTGSQVGKNEVLINAWQMNTRWTCSVKTVDGKELSVSRVSAFDPVQIYANATKRMNSASCTSAPVGTPQHRHHWFKVVAPDADTDLIITVKDDFGHTYTETMERPKKFDVATYKIEIK